MWSLFILTSPFAFAQIETPQDSTSSVLKGTLELNDIDKIIKSYTYDPETDRYIYRVQIDDYDMQYPLVLTRKQYEDIIIEASMKEWQRQKMVGAEGKRTDEELKDYVRRYTVTSVVVETIFGGDTVIINAARILEVDVEVRYTKQDTPLIPPINRTTSALDFKP